MSGDSETATRATVVVHLPPALIRLFPGAPRQVELDAASVRELVDGLEARWPGMRDRLCDSSPQIRCNINVFIGGERAGMATRFPPGTEIHVLTAISGG